MPKNSNKKNTKSNETGGKFESFKRMNKNILKSFTVNSNHREAKIKQLLAGIKLVSFAKLKDHLKTCIEKATNYAKDEGFESELKTAQEGLNEYVDKSITLLKNGIENVRKDKNTDNSKSEKLFMKLDKACLDVLKINFKNVKLEKEKTKEQKNYVLDQYSNSKGVPMREIKYALEELIAEGKKTMITSEVGPRSVINSQRVRKRFNELCKQIDDAENLKEESKKWYNKLKIFMRSRKKQKKEEE